MTELYIDGVQVVLPGGFSIETKIENPFITKNGEYTYDITLNLSNPVNAELYKHLHRINSLSEIKSKRSAYLISDHRVYCNGTEIITGWTDETVSIQIASGNSELNYFIGADQEIASLDMGKAAVPDDLDTFLRKYYPDVDYNFPPVKVGDYVANNVQKVYTIISGRNGEYSFKKIEGNLYIPMPFVCAYLEKLMSALGYTILENQLASTPWKKQILIHGQNTLQYAEMLPGWTVKAFLEEMEKLYGVIFHITAKDRSVRILLSSSYYINAPVAYLHNVIDPYEQKYSDNEVGVNLGMRNLSYEFPSDSYYSKRRLSKEVLKIANKVEMNTYTDVRAYIEFDKASGTDIVIDKSTGDKYIRASYEKIDMKGDTFTIFYACPVDEFPDLIRDKSSEDKVSLAIIPVRLDILLIEGLRIENGTRTSMSYNQILPSITESNGKPVSSEEGDSASKTETSLETMIDKNNNDTGKSTLYAGFYAGIKDQLAYHRASSSGYFILTNSPYPTVYTDELLNKGFIIPYRTTQENAPMSVEGESMKLDIISNSLFKSTYDISFDKEYTFESYDPNLYDIRSIFVIRNKRYICKEMDFVLDAKGRKGAWKGVFCPIKISDIEANARWILNDGKWRDGGVWLDNGRWLD